MKAKPKAAKYRNLRARGGLIQYRRMVAGKLVRFSTNTDDWDAAAAVARLYEERKGIGRPGVVIVESPTLATFASVTSTRTSSTSRRRRVRGAASTSPRRDRSSPTSAAASSTRSPAPSSASGGVPSSRPRLRSGRRPAGAARRLAASTRIPSPPSSTMRATSASLPRTPIRSPSSAGGRGRSAGARRPTSAAT